MNKRLLIIIPAHNEEKHLTELLSHVKLKAPDVDIAIINDGSTDNTAMVARQTGAKVLSLVVNMGYGIALQTGYKYALRKGYHYLVQMDADGQHGIDSLPDLIAEITRDEADIVVGSRFLGKLQYEIPWQRRMGMYLFSFITSICIKQKITDPTSGFQAINSKVMCYYAQKTFPSDYPDADVLIMANRAGFKIKEVPVVMYGSVTKKSMHSGLKPVYYIYKMFLSIAAILLRKTTHHKNRAK